MACRAVGVDGFFLVAIDAKLHFNRYVRLRERQGHRGHVPVTVLAGDFPERDVPAVGEVGVVGHPVNLDPGD